MDVAVIAEGPDAGDHLRSLRDWLADSQELRGRVEAVELPPETGTLGPVLDALSVALGPAGAVSAFATGIIAWLRTRRGDVHIKVTLPEGSSLELAAKRVSGLDTPALQQQVAQVADLLRRQQAGSGEPEPERHELP
ncbi:effector-associated constant component EACC1 [Streptomyces sp. NPDC054956]